HRQRPIAMIPQTWLGKGQLLFLLFLWMMVIANFSKALVAFSDGRIATEGMIIVNALICTFLILGQTPLGEESEAVIQADFGRGIRKAIIALTALLFTTTFLYTAGVRGIYGDKWTGWGGNNRRFGADADWRVKPLLKTRSHN